MIRADIERFLKVKVDSIFKIAKNDDKFKQDCIKNPDKVKAAFLEYLKKHLAGLNSEHFQKFKEGSPEYERAEKYFEAEKEYFNNQGERNNYKNNLLEKEATYIGGLMQEVAKYIGTI